MSEERRQRDSGTAEPEFGDAGSNAGATPDESSTGARPSGKRAQRSSVELGERNARGSEKDSSERGNIFTRLAQFVREIIAELRKVIWPNRRQLTTYTIVVIVFVSVMTALIFGLDVAFGSGVSWLFG